MARTIPSTSAALAVLASAFEPAETVLSRRTLRLRDQLLASARVDLDAAVERVGVVATAAHEEVARSTLALWRADGWLSGECATAGRGAVRRGGAGEVSGGQSASPARPAGVPRVAAARPPRGAAAAPAARV